MIDDAKKYFGNNDESRKLVENLNEFCIKAKDQKYRTEIWKEFFPNRIQNFLDNLNVKLKLKKTVVSFKHN